MLGTRLAYQGPRRNLLGIEYLELFLVLITEGVFSDGRDVDGLVVALVGDGVDLGVVACDGDRDGDVPEENADGSEGGVVDGYPGVMGEALVAGEVVKIIGMHGRVVREGAIAKG